jgi:hypothetical protein
MNGAPLFNTGLYLWKNLRESSKYAHLSISDGHVIGHTLREPACLARFEDTPAAEKTLLAAGWSKRADPAGDRYFESADLI